jgi:hypothetical protein
MRYRVYAEDEMKMILKIVFQAEPVNDQKRSGGCSVSGTEQGNCAGRP